MQLFAGSGRAVGAYVMPVAGLVVGAAIAAVALMPAGPGMAATRPLPSSVPALMAPIPSAPVDSVAALERATVAIATPQPPAAPPLKITRRGGLWHIEAQGASRLEAAHEFARLQGTVIDGAPDALAAARSLTLHWSGADVMDGWRLLLDNHVAYSLTCTARRCRPFVLPEGGAVAMRYTPSRPAPSFDIAGRPVTDNAALAPPARERVDPPDDRVGIASHHD